MRQKNVSQDDPGHVGVSELLSSHFLSDYPKKVRGPLGESLKACWKKFLKSDLHVHVFFFKPAPAFKKKHPATFSVFSPYSRGKWPGISSGVTLSLVSPNSIHFTATKPKGDRA